MWPSRRELESDTSLKSYQTLYTESGKKRENENENEKEKEKEKERGREMNALFLDMVVVDVLRVFFLGLPSYPR